MMAPLCLSHCPPSFLISEGYLVQVNLVTTDLVSWLEDFGVGRDPGCTTSYW